MRTIGKHNWIQKLIFMCSFLACMVPRYISTFKIPLGIYISLYTVLVVLVWLVYIRKIRFYKKIESCIFGIWFLFVILSAWRAQRIGVWLYYVDWTLTAILFSQILYFSDKSKLFDNIINALLLGLFIHLIIGLYEVSAHRYLFAVGDFGRRYYGTTAISIFHNPNDYVTFVITMLPFSLYVLNRTKRGIVRIVQVFIIIASVYLVIKSESRGGFLSLVLLALTMGVLYYKKSDKNKVIIISLSALSIILAFSITPIRSYLFGLYSLNRVDSDGVDIARVNLIKNGFYFLKQTYGFGVGAGNLIVWLTEKSIYSIGKLGLMHNWYMEILVTFGVFFFAVYCAYHLKIIFRLLGMFDRKDEFWNLNNTFLASFICFSLVSISSSSNVYSEWMWMYLVLVSTYVMFNCSGKKVQMPIRRNSSIMHTGGLI